MPAAHRYALYYAPTGHWADLSRHWLGRDEQTGAPLPALAGVAATQAAWTQAPRHYGLHATLKPPFRLHENATPEQVHDAARALAIRHVTFAVTLQLSRLRRFLAWTLSDEDAAAHAPMRRLADDAMASLDALRAPPTPEETARRRSKPLSAEQEAMLARWAYPYAQDTFTFHITLTGALEPDTLTQAQAALVEHLGGDTPVTTAVSAVSVYVQPHAGDDFIVARHYDFNGQVRDASGARWLTT